MRRIAILLMLIASTASGQSAWQGLPITNNEWYTLNQQYHPFSQLWAAASERFTAIRKVWPSNSTPWLVDQFVYVSGYSNQTGSVSGIFYTNVVPVYTTNYLSNSLDLAVRTNTMAVSWLDEAGFTHTGICYIAVNYYADLTYPYQALTAHEGDFENSPSAPFVLTNWTGGTANFNVWFSTTNASGSTPQDFPGWLDGYGDPSGIHADPWTIFYYAFGGSNTLGTAETDSWGRIHAPAGDLSHWYTYGFSRDMQPRSMLMAQASATNGGWDFECITPANELGLYAGSMIAITNPVIIYNTTGAMPTVTVTASGSTDFTFTTVSEVLTFTGMGAFTNAFILVTNLQLAATSTPGDSVTIMYTNGVRFFSGLASGNYTAPVPFPQPQELDKNDFNERQRFLNQFAWATLPCTWYTVERTWSGVNTDNWADALSTCRAATPTVVTNTHPPSMWTLSFSDGNNYNATAFSAISYPVVGANLPFSTSTNTARDIDWYLYMTNAYEGLYDTTNTYDSQEQDLQEHHYTLMHTTTDTHAAPCTSDVAYGSASIPNDWITPATPAPGYYNINRTGWRAIDPPRALLRFHFKYY